MVARTKAPRLPLRRKEDAVASPGPACISSILSPPAPAPAALAAVVSLSTTLDLSSGMVPPPPPVPPGDGAPLRLAAAAARWSPVFTMMAVGDWGA